MGDDNNAVSREVALGVLRQYAKVAPTGSAKDTFAVTGHDGTCEVMELGEELTKRRLNYLSRKYGVPIRHWYNPELVKVGMQPDQKIM